MYRAVVKWMGKIQILRWKDFSQFDDKRKTENIKQGICSLHEEVGHLPGSRLCNLLPVMQDLKMKNLTLRKGDSWKSQSFFP